MNDTLDIPADFIEIKAQVFMVIRANSESRNPKKVMKAIKEHLPDVDPRVIRQALNELYT